MSSTLLPYETGTTIQVPYQVVVYGYSGLHILSPGTYYISDVKGNLIEIKNVNNTVPIYIYAQELEKLEFNDVMKYS